MGNKFDSFPNFMKTEKYCTIWSFETD